MLCGGSFSNCQGSVGGPREKASLRRAHEQAVMDHDSEFPVVSLQEGHSVSGTSSLPKIALEHLRSFASSGVSRLVQEMALPSEMLEFTSISLYTFTCNREPVSQSVNVKVA